MKKSELKSVKKGLTKLVRIDHKTQIEVSVDIRDEVAIKKYHKNYGKTVRGFAEV
ncbi:unnamed protein product [marine sediment metagenome]|uniref:Uncharacterized protein n=1 Tax=marine sediment metagenome TaxID=412755 RepID=X1CNP7_9ZZZZ